jgi:murein hydrolase activator
LKVILLENKIAKMNSLSAKYIIVVALMFLGIMVSAQTDKKAEILKQQQKQIEKNLLRTKSLLKETSTKTKMSLNDLSLLKNQIENRKNLINSYTSEIVVIESQIGQMSNDLDHLQLDLLQMKKEYANLIRQSYKSRNSYDQWMFVFASKDFYQAMKRIRYLVDYTKYRRQKAVEIVATSNRINQNLAQLGVKKTNRIEVVSVKEKEAKELEKDKITKEITLKKLKGQEKELRKEMAKQQKDWEKLNNQITNIIAQEIKIQKLKAAEEARKKELATKTKNQDGNNPDPVEKTEATTTNATTNKTTTRTKIEASPADVKLSNDFILNQGKLPWPSERAEIVSHFGTHAHEELAGIVINNHGVDFGCEHGDVARAVFSGKVSRIISIPAGYAVLIQHGTYYTVYTNLSSVNVKEGQNIETKQNIGTIAVDPIKKETVLHFELWKGQTIQNPEVWLRR